MESPSLNIGNLGIRPTSTQDALGLGLREKKILSPEDVQKFFAERNKRFINTPFKHEDAPLQRDLRDIKGYIQNAVEKAVEQGNIQYIENHRGLGGITVRIHIPEKNIDTYYYVHNLHFFRDITGHPELTLPDVDRAGTNADIVKRGASINIQRDILDPNIIRLKIPLSTLQQRQSDFIILPKHTFDGLKLMDGDFIKDGDEIKVKNYTKMYFETLAKYGIQESELFESLQEQNNTLDAFNNFMRTSYELKIRDESGENLGFKNKRRSRLLLMYTLKTNFGWLSDVDRENEERSCIEFNPTNLGGTLPIIDSHSHDFITGQLISPLKS